MKLSRKSIVIIFFCFFCVLSFILASLSKNRANIKVSYCRVIGNQIQDLKTQQFQLNLIDYGDTEEIVIFHFSLKNKSKYNHNQCIEDISIIKKTITEFLNQNTLNKLNSSSVAFIFQTLPGDSISMFNYNNNEKIINPAQFQFFSSLNVSLSSAIDFYDAKTIDIKVDEKEKLYLLENFKNLERVYLSGEDLTEDEKIYLINILPDCKIIYNGISISDICVE
jgi:hypothetical protein